MMGERLDLKKLFSIFNGGDMSGTFNFRLLFSVSILLFGIILSAQETAKDFEGRQSLSDFGSEVPEKMLEASSVDMIIINDSKIALDGGFFGDDVVIPYIIMSALRSRRAPILINGSLASIVLKCATQPDEFESKSNSVKILSHFFKTKFIEHLFNVGAVSARASIYIAWV